MKRPAWLNKALKWFFVKGLDTAAKLLWGAIFTVLLAVGAGVILYLRGAPQKWLYMGIGAFSALAVVIIVTVVLNVSGLLKEEQTQPQSTTSNLAADREPCPDYWLHQIAETDKRFINQYVKVEECEIFGHDFMHQAPYVEFKLTILNSSVYAICIEDSVKGDIRFHTQLLSKDVKKIENDARCIEHGKTGHYIVRQWLSREEVGCILSASEGCDSFRFDGLELTIKCRFPETDMESKRLDVYGLSISSKPLRDLHKPLEISIQQAGYKGHWNFADNPRWRRIVVNLQVSIFNPRSADIAINGFNLSARIKSTDYGADAEVGEIYEERRFIKNGEEEFQGQKLSNLNHAGKALLTIPPNGKAEGWLQFLIIPSPQDAEDDGIKATLTFTDSAGEKHSKDCWLIYTQ